MSEQVTPPAQPAAPSQEVVALQQELSAMKNYLNEIGPFVQDASALISAIAADPGLKSQVIQATNQQKGQPAQPPQQPQNNNPQNWKFDPQTGQPIQSQVQQQPAQTPPSQPSIPPQLQGMDVKMREDIIGQIESKYGYNSLPADKRKELRQNVEQRLRGWNTSVLTAPVNELPKLLEDAYMLTDMPKAQEEGRLSGLIEARNNEMAMLPGMNTAQQKPETTQLTSEHQKWAKRWNLNEDKVAERMKEFKENGVMTYKPKEQQPAQAKPVVSGQPPAQ